MTWKRYAIKELPPGRPWTLESLEEDPSCLDPAGCIRIMAEIDAGLALFGQKMNKVLFGSTDFRQRTLYSVDTDPGDISWHEFGFARDRGAAKSREDDLC